MSACASVAAECTPTDDSATQDVINTCAAEAANGESACTTAAGGVCRYIDLENMCTGQTGCVYDDASSDDVCEATDNVDTIPRCTLIEAEDDSSSAVAAARDACLGGLTIESSECSYISQIDFVPAPDCAAVFLAAVKPTAEYCPTGCTFEYDSRDDKMAAGCSYTTAPTKPPDNSIPPGCIKQGSTQGACNSGAPYLTKMESNKWSLAVTLVVIPAALDLSLTHVEVLAGAHSKLHANALKCFALSELVMDLALSLIAFCTLC